MTFTAAVRARALLYPADAEEPRVSRRFDNADAAVRAKFARVVVVVISVCYRRVVVITYIGTRKCVPYVGRCAR